MKNTMDHSVTDFFQSQGGNLPMLVMAEEMTKLLELIHAEAAVQYAFGLGSVATLNELRINEALNETSQGNIHAIGAAFLAGHSPLRGVSGKLLEEIVSLIGDSTLSATVSGIENFVQKVEVVCRHIAENSLALQADAFGALSFQSYDVDQWERDGGLYNTRGWIFEMPEPFMAQSVALAYAA